MSAEIDGVDTFARSLARAGAGLADMEEANARAGTLALHAAVARAPVRSGALVASGRTEKVSGRARIVFGNARVHYALPIHWGWRAHNIEPNPFASAGAQATEGQWTEVYQEAAQKILDDVTGA